jgi:hypothetical protein
MKLGFVNAMLAGRQNEQSNAREHLEQLRILNMDIDPF